MRVPSELLVKALIRRCGAEGASAVVVRRGDEQRGAVFVKVRLLDGTAKLFGPAPAGLSESTQGHRHAAHLDPGGVGEAEADAYLARQVEFDPDLWLVEVEDRGGRSFLPE